MLDKQTLALVITFLIAGAALGFSIFMLVKAPQIFKKGDGDDDADDEDKDTTALIRKTSKRRSKRKSFARLKKRRLTRKMLL